MVAVVSEDDFVVTILPGDAVGLVHVGLEDTRCPLDLVGFKSGVEGVLNHLMDALEDGGHHLFSLFL